MYRSFFPIHKSSTKSPQKSEEPQMKAEESLKLRLLLNATQMVEEGYPLPLPGLMQEKYADYVMTSDEYKEVHPNSPLYSIDCEMCLTEAGKMELTRICVVDSELNVSRKRKGNLKLPMADRRILLRCIP